MKNKYDEAYDTIIFKIARMLFGEPVLRHHIEIIDGWARQIHIYETIHQLNSEVEIQNPYKVEKVELEIKNEKKEV